jgi:oligosaccharide repeat unit polymerase
VWFLTLALFFLRLVEYTPVRVEAWRLIVINLISFGFGWMLAYLFQRPGVSTSKMELGAHRVSPERLRKVIYLSFALGMVGLAEFLRRVQGLLGLTTYLVAPHEIRQAMVVGGGLDEGFKLFNWLNVMSVVLCAFYLRSIRGGPRRLVWTILILSVVATLFLEDRTRFFFALVWAAFVVAHIKNLKVGKLLTTGLILAVVLVVQFVLVAVWLGKIADNNPVLLESANISEPYFPVLTPYMYLTGSYPALQTYLDARPDSTSGAMTFYPAFKMLRLVNPSLKPPLIVAEPVGIPSEFNTFTWLHQFYTDFGVAGVILGPLVVAFLSGLVYFRMLRTKSFSSLYVNGLISFGLSISFLVNQLTEGPAWYFLAIGVPIAKYVSRRGSSVVRR